MALQQRKIASSRKNVKIGADVGKAGGLARPPLQPLINCNVPAKPLARLDVKAKYAVPTETVKTLKKTVLVEKTCTLVKTTKVISKSKVKTDDVKPTVGEASKVLRKKGVEQNSVKTDQRKALAFSLGSFSSQLYDVEDIDNDTANPLHAPPYANDIYTYLRELERKYPVQPAYLRGQRINGTMRTVLLNWIVEVHDKSKMSQESIHLTIGILDRFLQDYRKIDRTKLQLVGVTCLLIAGKYEDMVAPDVCELVYISKGACTKDEILKMERTILSTLDFNLGKPLPLHFLRRFTKAAKGDELQYNMGKYIIELGLLDYSVCHHPPSLLAAASLYLSLWLFSGKKSLSEKLWTDTLVFYSTYHFADLTYLVKILAALLTKAETMKYKVSRNKFSSRIYLKVSLNEVLKSSQLQKLALL